MLKGKHIILGISGGIAAYKSASLLRLFIKAGAEVQVVITPAGKEFITPVTLSALSGKPVICDFFTANTGSWNSHVDLGLWADAMVIAPATASTIAKMANGVADNMLITTYLSAKAPVFLVPAMDLDMFAHPSTKANIERLKSYGNHIIEPAVGELASHLTGKGRMEEPEKIFEVLNSFFAQGDKDLKGRKIMITAGPTHEKIDPVRYIGNYSTGKMGYALAEECAGRGAEVILISGPVNLSCRNPGIQRIDVESAGEMYAQASKYFENADAAIMCAAVADYCVENQETTKIKRENSDAPVLKLKKNPDIAASLGKVKKPSQILVGFALETNNELENAKSKLQRKNLDFIVLNSLRDPQAGFGTDTNKICIIEKNGNISHFEPKMKDAVATDIINLLTKEYLNDSR